MTRTAAALAVLGCLGRAQAQETETYVLRQTVSNRETIVCTRVIEFDGQKRLFHVRGYHENGRLQMDAFYSSLDRQVKEDYQCNYRSNTKEGLYKEWYRNGRTRFTGHFNRGLLNGVGTVVPFEETERLVRRLQGMNRNLRFSAEPDLGHSIHWQVYPAREIYGRLLQHERQSRK
jgi:hypothetical protein